MIALILASAMALSSTDSVKAFRLKHADFYLHPEKAGAAVSPHLLELLKREEKCSDGYICAIEADPWTDAQDGDVSEPITFEIDSHAEGKDVVRMCYRFVLDARRPKSECSRVVVSKTADGRWLVDDLIAPDGKSLRHLLETYPYDASPAN